jgi:hypothetical protein
MILIKKKDVSKPIVCLNIIAIWVYMTMNPKSSGYATTATHYSESTSISFSKGLPIHLQINCNVGLMYVSPHTLVCL